MTSLAPVLSKHMLSVTPVLGVVVEEESGSVTSDLPTRLGLRLNPAEVDAAFAAPASLFVDGPPGRDLSTLASRPSYSFRDARFGPCRRGPPFRLHFFEVEPVLGLGGLPGGVPFTVWGLTAGISMDAAAAALGRAPAFQRGPDAAPGLDYHRIAVGADGRPGVREEAAGEEVEAVA